MCRSTDYRGYQSNVRERRLRIRAFFVRFSGLSARKPLPESVTLLYLPRISGNALDVDGSKIPPDSPAFVTLHRVVTAKTSEGEVVYGSRERVRASEGLRFEVYLREEKVLKGIFRKNEGEEWKLECKCAMESEELEVEVTEAEVCVAVEGHVEMNERVQMVVRKNNRSFCGGLEEIPEEGEEEDTNESDGCCCCCGGEKESGLDGGDVGKEGGGEDSEMETEIEGVRWAVDVGIWVMCLGVGLLVSKASSKRLRRRSIF